MRCGGILLVAAFQLVVVTATPVADALLDAASAALPIHVESERPVSCGDGHGHLFCQLCRTLAFGSAQPLRRLAACPPPAVVFTSWQRARGRAPTPVLAGSLGPRAPPLS
jgi:hypothetical protein